MVAEVKAGPGAPWVWLAPAYIPHARVREGWLVSIMDGILNRSAEDVGDLMIPGFIKRGGTRAAKETAGRPGAKS